MYMKNKLGIKIFYNDMAIIDGQWYFVNSIVNTTIDIFDNIEKSPGYIKGYRYRYINNEQFGINIRLYEK
jgi:hypothetical protein